MYITNGLSISKNDLANYVGDRKIVLARELTKIHEEFIRGTIEEIQEKITTPKGEYVIIIDENSDIDTNEENELNKYKKGNRLL